MLNAVPGIGDRGEQESGQLPTGIQPRKALNEETVWRLTEQVSSSLHYPVGTYRSISANIYLFKLDDLFALLQEAEPYGKVTFRTGIF